MMKNRKLKFPIAAAKVLVHLAIAEDVGSGDITTSALLKDRDLAQGVLVAREDCVAAGLPIARLVFKMLDPHVNFTPRVRDGARVRAGQALARVRGPARAVLAGERTALNFLQRLSGIATLTARYVRETLGTRARILDTRKTHPGWRKLDKYAVRCGGGSNHREGLFDQALIKDNHLALLTQADRGIAEAVRTVRRACRGRIVEVEVDTLTQLKTALTAAPDIVLLDNMDLKMLRQAVRLRDRLAPRVKLEASGGITLKRLRAVARTGVDFISVGALTHSARAVDLALDFE